MITRNLDLQRFGHCMVLGYSNQYYQYLMKKDCSFTI